MEDLVTRVGGRMGGYTILVEDTAACDGTFLIHYMIMKLLTAESNSRVVLLGLSEPFSHYNRVARKQGCNLQSWSDKGRFAFIGLSPGVFNKCGQSVNASGGEKDSGSMADASKESQFHPSENPFISLYLRIRDFVKNVPAQEHTTGSRVGRQTCILIDDISVLEVIAGGVENVVLDFVHYCQALSCGDKRCSVVMLTHQDVHESWPANLILA